MSAVEIELARARMTEAELGHAADRLVVVADAVARAESSAQIGAEALGVSRSIGAVTDDVRRLGRLLSLVADRAESADDLPAGFYDRWIAGLASAIEATSNATSVATATAGDIVAQPSLASYGPLAGIVFVSDPSNPAAGTTTTSPSSSTSITTQFVEDSDSGGFGASVGRSVPLDSGTHHGRNATACDVDPDSCHGEVTSDDLFAVLGFVPVVGEVLDAAFCAGGDNISCGAIIVPFAGGKALRLAGDSSKAASRASDGFRITDEAWEHITGRHLAGGQDLTPDASLWVSEDDIVTHIGNAHQWSPSHFNRGNTVIVADAGVTVGIDGVTKQPISAYTVVLNSSGEVITAHPGLPRELERWN